MASEPPGGASPVDPRRGLYPWPTQGAAGRRKAVSPRGLARRGSRAAQGPYLRRGARISALSLMAIRASLDTSVTVTLRIIWSHIVEQRPTAPRDILPTPRLQF